uniref:Ig-like domain-containing protein n=1 Tax=Sinocyclocheilus anshuiensis TaxID=1608454 RepID=A0A671Q520_9TELE
MYLAGTSKLKSHEPKTITTKSFMFTVTLSCSYDTSSSYVRLYWYRQYLNEELHYLIYKYSGGGGGSPSDPRFQSTIPQSSTELTITGVTLSDSALYYCALRVGAQ